MKETRVSGRIFASKCRHDRDGEEYIVRHPLTGCGWTIPTADLEPADLRALADRIERIRTLCESSEKSGAPDRT